MVDRVFLAVHIVITYRFDSGYSLVFIIPEIMTFTLLVGFNGLYQVFVVLSALGRLCSVMLAPAKCEVGFQAVFS